MVRMFCQSIGGLNQQDQSFNTIDLIATQDNHEFDILWVFEINLDIIQHCVREDLNQSFSSSRGGAMHYSSSPIKVKYRYKPGGVLMSTVGTVTERHIGGCNDPLDQWVGHTFIGKQFKGIHVLTLYRPCAKLQGSSNKGKITICAQ